MRTRARRLASGVLLFTSAVFVLAACGGGSSAGTAVTPAGSSSTAGQSSGPAPAANGTTVTVTEKEFSIALSQNTFTPGTYTFKVTNQGQFSHNLTIEGPGVDKTASPTLATGTSGDVTVSLQAGTYELWCSVDSHKDKGMDMTITVA